MRVPFLQKTAAAAENRYARQLALPSFGAAAQEKLRNGKAAVVGIGGLGSAAANYLVAAGVGTLLLIDNETVEVSNLHRQALYSSSDVGVKKVEAAKRRLTAVNDETNVTTHSSRITAANAAALLHGHDVVLDCSDNPETRDAVNRACLQLKIPLVYGSAIGMEGQVAVFTKDNGCYRCLYPQLPMPKSCSEEGVLGTVPGVIGLLQATEAIKLIAGTGEVLRGRVLFFNAAAMTFKEFKLPRQPQCVACGSGEEVQKMKETITAEELKQWKDSNRDFQLIDIRESDEREISQLENADWIRMDDVPKQLDKISRSKPVVVFCRTDNRSGMMQRFLRSKGYDNVIVLKGGINEWAEKIEPDKMQPY